MRPLIKKLTVKTVAIVLSAILIPCVVVGIIYQIPKSGNKDNDASINSSDINSHAKTEEPKTSINQRSINPETPSYIPLLEDSSDPGSSRISLGKSDIQNADILKVTRFENDFSDNTSYSSNDYISLSEQASTLEQQMSTSIPSIVESIDNNKAGTSIENQNSLILNINDTSIHSNNTTTPSKENSNTSAETSSIESSSSSNATSQEVSRQALSQEVQSSVKLTPSKDNSNVNAQAKDNDNSNASISNINHNIAKDSHSSATTSETSEFKNYLSPKDINNYFEACIHQKDKNGSYFFNTEEQGYIRSFKETMMGRSGSQYSPNYYRYFECEHYTDDKGAKFLNFKFFNDDSTIQTQHVTIQFPSNDPQIGYCFFYNNKNTIQGRADGVQDLVSKFYQSCNKLLFRFPKNYEPPIDYKKNSNESYSQKQSSVNGAMEVGPKVNNAHELNNALQENPTSTNMSSLNKQTAVDQQSQPKIANQDIPSNTTPKHNEESNTSISHDNSITNSIATPITESNSKTDNTEVVKLKENTINNNSAKESHSSGFKNHFFLKSDMENCIKACINQKDENGSSFFSNDEQRYINTFQEQIADNCAGFKSYYYRYFNCERGTDDTGKKFLKFKFFDDNGKINEKDYVIITFPKDNQSSNAYCNFYKDGCLIATANNPSSIYSAFTSAKSLFTVSNNYASLINDAKMLDENELQELYSKESTWSMGYMLANTKLPGASDIHNGLIQQAGIIKNNTSQDKQEPLVKAYNTIDQKIGSAIHEKFKDITNDDGYFLNADKKSIGCSKEMKQQIVNASRIIYGKNPISITSVLGQNFLEQCNNIFNEADVKINCSEDKIVNLLLHKHLQFAGKVSKGRFTCTETGDIVYQ